ncbi:hypothetical protein D1818_13215 [Aquimarina sp. BL5]|uniref:hypothetical protein n=1 Tax=Aquimarina sp. BL5 TaxID=1714860 RepID=UPI000E517FE1|nr:hypothetical protein [Aquimarina sp. BL5]AXT51755.1 hypothetical protein D1818_13215 [Aquimarina sp. BL5]RKM96895.1 hypothetical protein D7036_20800 [Aquimarina sp. BL5]
MKNSKYSFWLYSFVLLLFSCEKADVNESKTNSLEQHSKISDSKAKITLSNGNIVRFQKIDDGELKGTFILEESDCNECSVLENITKLAGKEVSEQEVFWALSEPGTQVPSFLKIKHGETLAKNSELQEQGWARDVAVDFPIGNEGNPTRVIACKNSDFTSSIAYGFLGTPEFVALDKTPNNYFGFINDCASIPASYCNKGPRYKLHAVMNGIKKWKGKICSKAIQNRDNDHIASNTSGGFCQSPPCDAYVGPELYFEYYSNGKWKSMKNPNGLYPEGFEVPANTTKVYTYSWNTKTNTSFRLRVKNAMSKDQFDFMMDKPDPVIDPPGGGGNPPTPEDFPQLPDYIQLSYGTQGMQNYRIELDFTNIIDDKPTIKIPVQFLPTLPEYDGEVIFPNNFCGIKVSKASRFIWLDNGGQVVETHPYNYVPENTSVQSLFGNEYYLNSGQGIRLTGPIGACEEANENWVFPFPLTQTETVMNQPLKLVIELEQDSEIEFLNYNIKPQEPLDIDELFEEVDFNELIEFFNETFYEGFQEWINEVCDENPADCPLQE